MAKWIRTDYGQLVNVAKFASIEICFIANRRYFSNFSMSEIDHFAIIGNYQKNTSTKKAVHRYSDKSLKFSYPIYTQDMFDVLLISGTFEAGYMEYLEKKLLEEIELLQDYLVGETPDYDFWRREIAPDYDILNQSEKR